MADDDKKEEKGNVMHDLWFVLGILAILIILWVWRGGPQKTSVKSLFINSPLSTSTVSGVPSIQ